ncbi:histidinol dehydrogenase [Nioella nitratireducens]|uniref:histidinol dehydrogenase n=1 Tax=Nioella nitratireducens TaxID=1287720 RepID=UPI0008FD5401|nr:histidinol dehydrogenase [Nioella nitratireducens]
MVITYVKEGLPQAREDRQDLSDQVSLMLRVIEAEGEAAVTRYARQFDRHDGPVLLSDADRARAIAMVPDAVKDDIRYAHDNIRRFAQAQRASVTDCEIELAPGLVAGQKLIPVSAAGCYVPGGRYSHVASALMTITTAKVAGVPHITAASPPKPGQGIPPAVIFTMDLAGADAILSLGGVQAVAAMAYGHFGLPGADILVGPGNQYVAEAKRQLFGPVGIDMVAGPTDSMILADRRADPETVAWDLVGQAEHGYNSPVWLVTNDTCLAQSVLAMVPRLIDTLPEPNAENARRAWDCFGEIILCDSFEDMARVADEYAPEHLHVQAEGLEWWLNRLRVYGSLFLGAETTVAFGDKCAGPNHVLPTSGAARYTGGLSVHKFLKTVTWQRATPEAARPVAAAAARISRLEGMEGHARTADLRLRG